MAKEFHITFSCGTVDDGAKPVVSQIQRLMKEGGAEFISKDEDDYGYMDAVFHHHTTPEAITKLCKEVIEKFKHSHVTVTTSVYEHTPSVMIDTKDTKNVSEFKQFVSSLAAEQGFVSIDEETDPTIWKITFERSIQRESFQNNLTAKAGEFMKNGNSSVKIFPHWEDVNFLQKNNYSDNKRTVKP